MQGRIKEENKIAGAAKAAIEFADLGAAIQAAEKRNVAERSDHRG